MILVIDSMTLMLNMLFSKALDSMIHPRTPGSGQKVEMTEYMGGLF